MNLDGHHIWFFTAESVCVICTLSDGIVQITGLANSTDVTSSTLGKWRMITPVVAIDAEYFGVGSWGALLSLVLELQV